MAKIEIVVDTDEEMCSVSIDGETIQNVEHASIYKEYEGDGYYITVSTREKMENGVTKSVHYASRASQKAMSAEKNGLTESFNKKGDIVKFEDYEDLAKSFDSAFNK